MSYAIDLTRHAFKRELGDITLYGTWLDGSTDSGITEPCLVLAPTYRRIGNGIKPVVIPLSAAYKYSEPSYAVRRAREYAAVLGFEDSMSTTSKIGTIIYDHLLDLIKMPPEPMVEVIVGEATVDGRSMTLTDKVRE